MTVTSASKAPLLRLVGLIELDPTPGDHTLIATGFARLPREVRHTGRVARLVGYESLPNVYARTPEVFSGPQQAQQQTRGASRVRFFGIEVQTIEGIPPGMHGVELNQTELSIWSHTCGQDGIVWRGSTSWDWFSVSGNGRCIGEFTADIPAEWPGEVSQAGRACLAGRACPEAKCTGRQPHPAGGVHQEGQTHPVRNTSRATRPVQFSVFANAYVDTSREMSGDEVVLVNYDPEWPAQYRRMADWLQQCLGSDVALRIEHCGSTAIPGMSAKPIVDMLVEVPSFRIAKERILPLLSDESWEYWWYSDHMILIKRSELMGTRTHHVHFAPRQHPVWQGIAFRDYLRMHHEYALRYEQLKRQLVPSCGSDREAYTAAKAEFVKDVTARALGALHESS